MAEIEAGSVDAVITDPPYGIGIKGERWDAAAIREAAGSTELSAGEAFEEWCGGWAGECLRVLKPGAHLLAFGSPRTFHRLAAGIEDAGMEIRDTLMWIYGTGMSKSRRYPGGLATALKPAFEPIVLARAPLEGTTAETIARHGTGALGAEECRINGRHPADVIVSHEPGCREGVCAEGCAAALLDLSAERTRARSGPRTPPSRFLYCPKVSRAERDAGCEELPANDLDLFPNAAGGDRGGRAARNPHPTVKPLALMRWLIRLACPPGGLVLDPFCGSGSTGAAAAIEGRRFVGIELSESYAEIAAARIAHWAASEPEAGEPPLGDSQLSEAEPALDPEPLLPPEAIEALARRLAELLSAPQDEQAPRFLTAEELAALWGLRRRWVYDHADELGARRLGSGPRPRLRFDPEEVEERLGAPAWRRDAAIAGDSRADSLSVRSRARFDGQRKPQPRRPSRAPRSDPGSDPGRR